MPTALELTRQEWQPYIEAARRRLARPKMTSAQQHERERLLALVREVALQLKRQYGAKRVILFGSLADTDWFLPDSDVDLAVEGLAAGDFWQAWGLVEQVIVDRPVDLIEIETASESLRHAIRRYGIEL